MKTGCVFILAVAVLVLIAFQPSKEMVKVYRTPNPAAGQLEAGDSWIYWYVISANSSYYTASSSSKLPVSSYSSLNWVKTSTQPSAMSAGLLDEDEVPTSGLGNAGTDIQEEAAETVTETTTSLIEDDDDDD